MQHAIELCLCAGVEIFVKISTGPIPEDFKGQGMAASLVGETVITRCSVSHIRRHIRRPPDVTLRTILSHIGGKSLALLGIGCPTSFDGIVTAASVDGFFTRVNVGIGFITKSAPQLNLFSFGFPMTILGTFFALYFSVDALQFVFKELIDEAIGFIKIVLGDLGNGR